MGHVAKAVMMMGVASFVIAGCASPPARFYTLNATADVAGTPAKVSVAVGPVSIPASVDRPQIVLTTGPNELQIDEFNRWAAPLQDTIARVVAENLVVLLDSPRVTLYGQNLNLEVDYRVQIEIRNFDSAPGKYVAVDAIWNVRKMKTGKTETGRTSLRDSLTDPGYDAMAAAHSRQLARVSDDIAKAIRALE